MGQGGDINMMIKQYDIISILGGGGNVGDMWVIYIYIYIYIYMCVCTMAFSSSTKHH